MPYFRIFAVTVHLRLQMDEHNKIGDVWFYEFLHFKSFCTIHVPIFKIKSFFYSTKNTILKKYDGRFKDIFQEIYEK
jgi:hypothetical protein